MTATETLRAMLDERGVEYKGGERSVRWRDRNGVMMQAFPLANGELGMGVWSCTPEQAIAATLGVSDATDARQGDVDLAAENAKLRELCATVIDDWMSKVCPSFPFCEYGGEYQDCTDETCGNQIYRQMARELGVEVSDD